MEWLDRGIVLGVRKHGETSVIAEIMTRAHGRHMGLVQGGRGRSLRPLLQPGNSVNAVWRARLEDHLGTFKLDAGRLRAARLMESAHATYAVQWLASLLRLLPERDAQPHLHDTLDIVLDTLDDPAIAAEMVVRYESAILNELGFGLDLSACASTGQRENLVHVSPRTGRAISREAGAPYADRLLRLPPFLMNDDAKRAQAAPLDDILAGFALTGHFMHRHVHGARGLVLPPEREAFIRVIERELADGTAHD